MTVKADKPMDAFDLLAQFVKEQEPKLTPEEIATQEKLDKVRPPGLPPLTISISDRDLVQLEPDEQIEESESAANRRLKEAQKDFPCIIYEESTPSPTS